MRPKSTDATIDDSLVLAGPRLIAIGVAILITGILWSGAAATSGAALVALGATGAVMQRYCRSPILTPVLIGHLFVYVSLYLLFVGAVAHRAMAGPHDGLSLWQGIDLGVSAGVMTQAVRLGLGGIYRGINRGINVR